MAPNPYLFLKDAMVSFGGAPLFSGISFQLEAKEKICLIGRNGCGKSTLLKVLAGITQLDGGEFYVRPGVRIGYLPQEVMHNQTDTIYEYVMSDIPIELGETHEAKKYLADMVLSSLGLRGDKPIKTLSGGKLRRTALAKALIQQPDVLLLDEPTNHLDLTSIEWLENYLKNYPGGLICISHDRAFLTAISEKTFWMDRGQLRVNNKGYQNFEEWSSQILELELQSISKLEKKVDAENLWLQQGVTARRKRNVRRLDEVFALRDQLRADKHSQKKNVEAAKLPPLSAEVAGKMVVEMLGVSHAFHDVTPPKKTITDLSLRIIRGERIGIMGRNGAGKTTFLRLLTKELTPDCGRIRIGNSVTLSYFDQKRQTLKPDATLWETLCEGGGDTVKVGEEYRHVASYLKDFMFEAKQFKSPVSSLSGGEASRLLLSKMLANPGNFMILDEPTNDLDMDTLDLLQDLLSEYKGTLLIVSHDRDFIDRIATRTLIFDGNGQIEDYIGGYSDYMNEKNASEQQAKKEKQQKKITEQQAKKPTKLSYNDKRDLEILPGRIEILTAEIAKLELTIADPALYCDDPDRFNRCIKELEQKKAELDKAETRWLELEEMREGLEGAGG